MSWAAAIIGGSAVIGGGLSYLGSKEQSSAAESAAASQSQAAQLGIQEQRRQFDISQKNLAPWLEAGKTDLANLQRTEEGTYERAVMDPNQYKQSPGYNWLQQQGIKGLQQGLSSTGQLGKFSADATKFGQGLALQDYTGYLGRLESLMNRYAGTAQVGQTASGQLANLGQNTANQIGNLYGNMGQAQAGGAINQANATTGLYNNLANIGSNAVNQYTLGNYLQNMGGGGGSSLPSTPQYSYTPQTSLSNPYGSSPFGG